MTIIIIFVLIIVLLILLAYIKIKEYTFINILTRTGNREKCFTNLVESLKKQTNQNFKHIKSNDNKNCVFLNKYKNVINVKKIKKSKRIKYHCPYNLYLNKLIEQVTHGWIMIIDDDCKFTNDKFLSHLSWKLLFSSKKDILIYNVHYGKGLKTLPGFKYNNIDDLKKIKIRGVNERWVPTIDMACMIFHSSNKTRFKKFCAADVRFFETAVNNGYNPVFVNIPIGIWANYNDQKYGKNEDCK